MFSKLTRLAVMVTALMSLVGIAQASASTWTVSGGTSFTASGNPGSLSTSRGTLACTGGTATGVFSATSHVGNTWNGAATGGVTFAGCRIGGVSYTVTGTYTLNAASYSGGVTTGTITPLSVSVNLSTTQLCTVAATSALGASYTNSTGVLAIPANTTSLTVSNGSGGTCPLGSGILGSLTALNFRVTSPSPAPQLVLGA